MPYIDVLRPIRFGNTIRQIAAALVQLCDGVQYEGVERFRVSVVTNHMSYGHPLEVSDSGTNKIKKKRWWERQDAPGQMYLPFQLFKPVKVKEIELYASGNRFRLSLQLDDEIDNVVNCYFDRYGHNDRIDNVIRAIQISHLEEKWVGFVQNELKTVNDWEKLCRPFVMSPELSESQQRRQSEQRPPSSAQCILSLRCALNGDGFVITPNGTVFNRASGTIIGYNLQTEGHQHTDIVQDRLREINSAFNYRRNRIRGNVRLASGELHEFVVNTPREQIPIETVDQDWAPSPRWNRNARFAAAYGAIVNNSSSHDDTACDNDCVDVSCDNQWDQQ